MLSVLDFPIFRIPDHKQFSMNSKTICHEDTIHFIFRSCPTMLRSLFSFTSCCVDVCRLKLFPISYNQFWLLFNVLLWWECVRIINRHRVNIARIKLCVIRAARDVETSKANPDARQNYYLYHFHKTSSQ